MGKILTVNFSKRVKGNSDTLLSIAEKHLINANHTTERINTSGLSIANCTGCMSCSINNKFCSINDDFENFTAKLINNDALTIASPVYFLDAPSIVKALTDRMLYYHNIIDFKNPKPANVLITAGRNGWLGNVLEDLSIFLLSSGFYVNELKIYYAQGPSEIVLYENLDIEIREFSDNLFRNKQINNPSSHCPICKTDKFKIISNEELICPICNIKGKIISYNDSGALILFNENDINNNRWSYENLKEHMTDWVQKSGVRYKSQVKNILKLRKQLLS